MFLIVFKLKNAYRNKENSNIKKIGLKNKKIDYYLHLVYKIVIFAIIKVT